MLAHHLGAIFDGVAGKVGGLGEGSAFQPARQPDQLSGGHVVAQRILSRPRHFAFDLDRGRIDFRKIAVNEHAVLGLERKIVGGIPGECALQIHAEHFELSVGGAAKDLRVAELCIPGHAACQVDGIAQVSFPVGHMFAGMAHFPAHSNHWRIFEVEPAEDAHRVEGLQRDILEIGLAGITHCMARSGAGQSIGKIEGDYLGSIVGRSQADDFGMARRRLGQKVGIRRIRSVMRMPSR